MAIESQKNTRRGFEEVIAGVSALETSDLERLAITVNQLLMTRKFPSLQDEQEKELLKKITSVIPTSLKKRQALLYKKLQNATITSKEHTELIVLNGLLEEKSAEKIKLLGGLVNVRKALHAYGVHPTQTGL